MPQRLLTIRDFEYLGAMRVPHEITGYGSGGLTHRYVGSQLRFFAIGHIHHGGPILEFTPTGIGSNWATAPRCALVANYGDIYGGRKLVEQPGNVRTSDLEWYDGKLYWSYAFQYNVSGINNPCLGLWVPGGAAAGPWRTAEHVHRTSGYFTQIPQAWADVYSPGKRLACGSGLSSGNISSSWGPNLLACAAPTAATPTTASAATLPLVQYSYHNRLSRENTYIPHSGDLPGGVWTQEDFITGACWIDLPDAKGVVFIGSLGAGNVWYGPSPSAQGWRNGCGLMWTGPHAERWDKRWWIYDPASFSPVSGAVPHGVQPASVTAPPVHIPAACFPDGDSMTFDGTTRTLYVMYRETEGTSGGNLPVIHAFRIVGEGTTPPPPQPPPPQPVPPPPVPPVAPPLDNASFVSQTVPTTMVAGLTYNASVTFKNTGTKTWSPYKSGDPQGSHRLAAAHPQDTDRWTGIWRDLPVIVKPGESVEVEFEVTAPVTPGTYNFGWGMILHGYYWFGEVSPAVPIVVNATADAVLPSAPTGVTITPDLGFKGRHVISWTAATDNVAVARYQILINGEIRHGTTELSNGGVLLLTDDSVVVRAIDAANNIGPGSTPVVYAPVVLTVEQRVAALETRVTALEAAVTPTPAPEEG